MNGTMQCSVQTVGGSCNFTCDEGFNLLGSEIRRCLPSVTWSGSTTICEPRRCKRLDPPDKGFVLLPCIGEYGTSCIIQCRLGYRICGPIPYRQSCILENSELKWTDPPTCTGNTLAIPAPTIYYPPISFLNKSYVCMCVCVWGGGVLVGGGGVGGHWFTRA